MKLRVLIADDEALGRERLRQFLQEQPQAELIAECASGPEAMEWIRRVAPDLVFLDVKMPGMDGFAVAEKLQGSRVPAIIFVTAYDRFAVRAFEIEAVDYLLKPFDRPRFQMAFNRAVERLRAVVSGSGTALPAPQNPLPRLAIKSQGRISLVNVAEVNWVSAADNYVELHLGKTTHLLRMTLKDVQAQLPDKAFVRISRSHLVNMEQVKELRSKSHGDAWVILHDGTKLPASRIYVREIRALVRHMS